ncbi:MAG: hypothetical protein SXQ77_01000, partial [Halobacteria archaeon]|nr:hypothetical protein [Halobacteria archaeon]
ALYGDWNWFSFLAGTAAVGVATAGSLMTLQISERIRRLDPPDDYARLLFSSSIDVVLGLLAYIAFVTYIFVYDPRVSDMTLLEVIMAGETRILAVYLMLLVLWDVCYRIGTGWWASVMGLWRTYRYRDEF